MVDGLFWIAKAAGAAPQLLPYAKNQYARYHGSEDGFDALLAEAKTDAAIPAGFTVAPAPSPADQAADDAEEGPAGKTLLRRVAVHSTNGSKDAVDQVWTAIKGKQVQLVAAVIEAAPDSLKLAGSVDDIDAKKADITLKLKEPLAAARLPKAGDELTIQGAPSEFTAGDNFNLVFTDGEVLKGCRRRPKSPRPVCITKPRSNQDGPIGQMKEGRPMCRPFYLSRAPNRIAGESCRGA